MTYRPEIDGLRSVAVIAVIAFHLDKTWLPGGFLGVDVFFTISGYLISSIILRECAYDQFNIWKFWKRRVKRLVPALAVMVACVMIVGNFLFIRPERTNLPMQAFSSLFSFANIFFWRTTGGYWTAPSESLPLLHTWTLSLEEQFYLCFPAVILLLRRFKYRLQLLIIAALLISSFLLCVLATPSFRSACFFLLPARMWELLLGVCLAYFHFARPSPDLLSDCFRWLPDLGLGLIGFSLWLIPNDDTFPGWKPLVPCSGTLLLLNARASQRSPTLTLLKIPSLVFVGKLSYSLYLWHWPVFVFLPYVGITSPFAKLSWTVSLAALSYFLIEKPLRYGSRGAVVGWVAVLCLVMAGFGSLLTFHTSPLLSKLGNLDDGRSLTRGHEYEATAAIRERGDGVFFGDRAKRPLLALVGSSHARVLGKPIHEYAIEHSFGFVSLATSNLGLTSLPHRAVPDAETVNATRIKRIREIRPDVIIVAGMWSEESKREDFPAVLGSVLRELCKAEGEVIVMGQVPMIEIPSEFDDDLRRFLVARTLSSKATQFTPAPTVAEANDTVSNVVRRLERRNVIFLDPTPFLLDGGQVKLTQGSLFLYSDHHHLNDDGARVAFDGVIRQVLEDAVAHLKKQPE